MTFEQLRVFLEIVQSGSFTKAATKLGVSQAAVSASVTALESRYKTLFFDRKNKLQLLTDNGQILLEEGTQIIRHYEAFQRRLERRDDGNQGILRIMTNETVLTYWLASAIEKFSIEHPGISIQIQTGIASQIAHAVAVDSADIGFIEGTHVEDDFVFQPLLQNKYVVIIGQHHPWFGRPDVSWQDFPQTAWVLREQGTYTRDLFERVLPNHGLRFGELDCKLSLPSDEAIIQTVHHGTSAGFLPESAVAIAAKADFVRIVPTTAVVSDISAITFRARKTSQTTRTFMAFVQTHIQTELIG
jgi:DNA-binding transcriptional LysR family regulator